jgi:hypothetical protein
MPAQGSASHRTSYVQTLGNRSGLLKDKAGDAGIARRLHGLGRSTLRCRAGLSLTDLDHALALSRLRIARPVAG